MTDEMRTAAPAGVNLQGRVETVDPFLEQAAIVVVPLRLGGGQRVKVLEALAAGKAVVATRRATAGLSVRDGEEVMLAETDEEFQAAIERLLADPRDRVRLATGARAWAERELRPERLAEPYAALYASLLEDTRG
jgi:glycosyltransferase involved in cell wall biosynthesis